MSEAPVLAVQGLVGGYGAAKVIAGVDLALRPGETLAIIGRNGMGKTTLLRLIFGLLRPMAGRVEAVGIASGSPRALARAGVAIAMQERALFPDLSIRSNLRLATPDDAVFAQSLPRALEAFPFLGDRLDQRAGTLSGGEQKMLLLARCVMLRPRLLLLDEISEGVQPSVVDRLSAVLRAEAARGAGILLVEQNVRFVGAVAARWAALRGGVVAAEGRLDAPDATARMHRELAF